MNNDFAIHTPATHEFSKAYPPYGPAKEVVKYSQAVDVNGIPDKNSPFIRNPVRFDPGLSEKLDLAASKGLVSIRPGIDFRMIDTSQVFTDQKVVLREKVLSLIEVYEAGLINMSDSDSSPVLVQFEFDSRYIIRDGNHRMTAMALCGYDYIPVRVIRVKDSFL